MNTKKFLRRAKIDGDKLILPKEVIERLHRYYRDKSVKMLVGAVKGDDQLMKYYEGCEDTFSNLLNLFSEDKL